jgi:pimeloyl-ACP methyl ester carboxylesterase
LEEQFDVFAPTLPGHVGGPPLEATSMASIVDQVERQLDDAGIDTAHVAGNSFGGWIAVLLAARGRARSVVALSPAGGWGRGTPAESAVERFFVAGHERMRRTRWVAPLAFRFARVRRMALAEVMEHGDRLTPDEALLIFRRALECPGKFEILDLVFKREGPVGEVGPIECPVLIAWSGMDRLLSEDSCTDGWRTTVPGAHWAVLPGVGHIPMTDDPDLVVATIRDHVAAASGSLAGS